METWQKSFQERLTHLEYTLRSWIPPYPTAPLSPLPPFGLMPPIPVYPNMTPPSQPPEPSRSPQQVDKLCDAAESSKSITIPTRKRSAYTGVSPLPLKRGLSLKSLPSSQISKGKLLPVEAVIEKYPKVRVESKAGTLACKLAKEAIFGSDVMCQCTPLGNTDLPALPEAELKQLKKSFTPTCLNFGTTNRSLKVCGINDWMQSSNAASGSIVKNYHRASNSLLSLATVACMLFHSCI